MQRYTTASCFATYLLPYVLFVADPEERERVARVCHLAWNIALFPSAAERTHHVEATADRIGRDAEGDAEPPPPGFRQGFADELTMLIELKRDLFPWQPGLITRVDLDPAPGRGTVDMLSVETAEGVERVELALNPSIMGAHVITGHLVETLHSTKAQRASLEGAARDTPELLAQALSREMLTAYCAQRADLRGYHRMLTAWCEEVASEPELRAGIGRFLAALDEIEDDTRAVLGILAAALGAPQQEL